MGAAPGLVAWGVPAVRLGLLLGGVHGAQGGRAAGLGVRAGAASSGTPRQGLAEAARAAGSLSSWGRTPGPGTARLAQRVLDAPGEAEQRRRRRRRELPAPEAPVAARGGRGGGRVEAGTGRPGRRGRGRHPGTGGEGRAAWAGRCREEGGCPRT